MYWRHLQFQIAQNPEIQKFMIYRDVLCDVMKYVLCFRFFSSFFGEVWFETLMT